MPTKRIFADWASSARRLMQRVVEVTPNERELLDLTEVMNSYADRLVGTDPHPYSGLVDIVYDQSFELATDLSPVVGRLNPLAPAVHISLSAESAKFETSLTRLHSGPPSHAHGGIVAGLLEQACAAASYGAGHIGYVERISIEFCEMTPLYEELRVEARTIGQLTNGRVICCAEVVVMTTRTVVANAEATIRVLDLLA